MQTFGGGGNDFQPTQQVTITLTADNDAGTAAISTVPFMRGTGGGSSDGLPAGITMSGDYDSYTELQNAFRDTGINIEQIILESDTTAHFNGTRKIVRYERLFNNVAGPTETIYLNKYKTDSGGGVSTTAIIADKPFFVTPRTVFNVEVIKNSSITITLEYNFEEKYKPVTSSAQ